MARSNLEYGAEVWGAGQWDEAELIEKEMGRRILRCSGKTTTEAVLGELGWWRMKTRREYMKMKYWINILLMQETRLVKKVYNHSKQEYLTKKKRNWVRTIHQLVVKYDLHDIWRDET